MSLKERISALVSDLLRRESPALKIGVRIFVLGMIIVATVCVVAAWSLLSPLWFFLGIGTLFAVVGGYIVNRELNVKE